MRPQDQMSNPPATTSRRANPVCRGGTLRAAKWKTRRKMFADGERSAQSRKFSRKICTGERSTLSLSSRLSSGKFRNVSYSSANENRRICGKPRNITAALSDARAPESCFTRSPPPLPSTPGVLVSSPFPRQFPATPALCTCHNDARYAKVLTLRKSNG